MKSFIRKMARAKVRIGLLVVLVAAVVIGLHLSNTTATHKIVDPVVVTVDNEHILTRQPSRLEKIRTLAESDHLALLEMAIEEYAARGDDDYSCTLIKQENIRGKMSDRQEIDVKFREKPFSVAMAWKVNPPVGDKLVYVDGKFRDNKGKSRMVVRPKSGFLQALVGGSVLRLPDCKDAMKNTLKPCTEFGFANSLRSLIGVYQHARKNGECEEKFGGFTEIDGRKCVVLERYLPYRKEYPAKKTVICLDIETLVPMQVVGYDWHDKLACNYEYRNVDMAAEFCDEDFTPSSNGIKGH